MCSGSEAGSYLRPIDSLDEWTGLLRDGGMGPEALRDGGVGPPRDPIRPTPVSRPRLGGQPGERTAARRAQGRDRKQEEDRSPLRPEAGPLPEASPGGPIRPEDGWAPRALFLPLDERKEEDESPVGESDSQSAGQSAYRSVSLPVSRPVGESDSQSAGQSASRSVSQPVSRSVGVVAVESNRAGASPTTEEEERVRRSFLLRKKLVALPPESTGLGKERERERGNTPSTHTFPCWVCVITPPTLRVRSIPRSQAERGIT